MNESLVGMRLGQYELQAHLGQGGMATVYRGFQPSLDRSVAVKVLPLARLPDPALTARFRREAQLAASLMHPNIVPVYDFGEWEGYLYIIMALVTGGTLQDRLQGRLPVEAVVRLVGQIADGLAYAHSQGIFHRDVKPTNVLLASADWAMLGDFGIARAIGDLTRLTGRYGVIGTPAYMAPEQWIGGEIDGRADIYSLGIVLYQLLAGTVPFTAPTSEGLMRQHLETPVPALTSVRPDLPAGIGDVVQTALAKEPQRRFRHAGELRYALEAANRSGRTEALPPVTGLVPNTGFAPMGGPTTSLDLGQTMNVAEQLRHPVVGARSSRSGSRHLGLIGLVLVLVVLLAGAIGYIAAGGSRAQGQSPAPTSNAAAVISQDTRTPTPQPAVVTPVEVRSTPVIPPTMSASTSAAPAAQPAPQPTGATDQRRAFIERHVSDYFAALNAGDYARAQTVCCTAGWRSRYPLEEWRRNFAGVTDLRFATPFRYPTVEANRIIAEVDYSFLNSSGARRYFTLRWTFVPSEGDWLADDAVASPQS